MTAEQKAQQAREQQKIEEMRRLRQQQKEKPKASADDFPIDAQALPAIGKPSMGGLGLPSIGGRQGAFEVDEASKRQAALDMMKLDDIMSLEDANKKPAEDGRSMMEVMKAKR